MSTGDEVRGMRDPPLRFGSWLTGEIATSHDERDLGRGMVESRPLPHQHPLPELARGNEVLISAYSPLAHGRVPDHQTLRWISGSGREHFEAFNFDLAQPETDEIELLPTAVRSANLPWEPDWNA